MTAELGINVGPPHESDPAALAATGASFIRTVYRSTILYGSWLTALKDRGIECWFVFDRSPESLGDDEGEWGEKLWWAKRFYGLQARIYQVGNEPDGNGIASWTMDKARVNRLLTVGRETFPRDEGFLLPAPGLVTGDPGWLEGIRLDLCDAVDAHAYSKFVSTPSERAELDNMLSAYRDRWGLPLWLGEFDSRTDHLSTYLKGFPGVERAGVFCWTSGQTAEEGITGMGISDNPRAMRSFLAATGGPANHPPAEVHAIFQAGFLDWSQRDGALLGTPLESESGGIGGFSAQETNRGFLTAAYIVDPSNPDAGPRWQLIFVEKETRARYLFRDNQSVRIA